MRQEGPQRAITSTSAVAQVFLSVVVLALFMPFVNKAFNIDDPLFIWAAKHILHNPLDFYGFDVNWYGKVESMAAVAKNPPLFSYYLSGTGILFGWSEISMHLAVMAPLIALALGTYRLAGQLDANPLQAALISVCTPAVMVSGTSVMCDVPMAALWVWAVSFWIEGNNAPYPARLLLSAGFIIAAGLTKYFGASLIPLLAAYSLMRRAPVMQWLPYLLFPLLIIVLYNFTTFHMYDIGLLTDAFSYSAAARQQLSPNSIRRLTDSLGFTGGGLIVVLFFVPLLFRRSGRLICAGGIAGLALLIHLWGSGKSSNFGISLQQAAFIITAGVLLSVAVSDFVKNRDDKSLLLALWIVGTFLFACYLNWTISIRTILPMAPAAGILISRRLVRQTPQYDMMNWTKCTFALIPALSLSLLVTMADYRWSNEIRDAADRIRLNSPNAGQRLLFQGHWGFQYYMEQIGGNAIDFMTSEVHKGDLIASPSINTNLRKLPEEVLDIVDTFQTTPLSWLAVMDPSLGAGFHSSTFGPLPYVFDRVKPEKYIIHKAKKSIRFTPRTR